ncbi:MAG: hypothetical protein COW63_06075 [Bacteroidetes bacterium CG18_big_fil_WC_8_21_14_2_50_41_14]|nr:MAG: hypothetical protein COW63_06075 [Bacteroidetes bacterium CG18_big_fil_WC_8_21_14_2_50_41_14]PIY33603.1 MAG: hypothetical protein COZ08_04975 [Bacteroidetes bacterium CG_4_10_14_3_um_filter_42_6]PJB56814.1 MAG: hypothetical protein CO098_12860 [Bacteroidetes bacterium CG_4_9_14_3_um_filter_41_19]
MKKRKKKFKSISLKLSARQMRSLMNYCEARKITPNKLIKNKIKYYTDGFDKIVPQKFYAQHNQLDLFDKASETLDIFG